MSQQNVVVRDKAKIKFSLKNITGIPQLLQPLIIQIDCSSPGGVWSKSVYYWGIIIVSGRYRLLLALTVTRPPCVIKETNYLYILDNRQRWQSYLQDNSLGKVDRHLKKIIFYITQVKELIKYTCENKALVIIQNRAYMSL